MIDTNRTCETCGNKAHPCILGLCKKCYEKKRYHYNKVFAEEKQRILVLEKTLSMVFSNCKKQKKTFVESFELICDTINRVGMVFGVGLEEGGEKNE